MDCLVTGLGFATSLGSTQQLLLDSILCGKNNLNSITLINKEPYHNKYGGEINSYLKDEERSTLILKDVIQNALNDADLDLETVNKNKVGLILGSFLGAIGELKVSSNLYNNSNIDTGNYTTYMAKLYHIDYYLTLLNACSASASAIALGMQMIRNNIFDIVIAGGYEFLGDYLFGGMNSLRVLGNNICPFDKARNGTIISEGAGIIILESHTHAIFRNAKVYAECCGVGMSTDGYHILRPHPTGEGIYNAMNSAILDSKIQPNKLNYINAHGTGTKLNDLIESTAIEKVLGQMNIHTPISSTKSITGHTLGASGVIESIVTILAINYEIVPYTHNLTNIDEAIKLNIIKDKVINVSIDYALSNSIGFGGSNTSLIFKKYENKKQATEIKIHNNVFINNIVSQRHNITIEKQNDLTKSIESIFEFYSKCVSSITNLNPTKVSIIYFNNGVNQFVNDFYRELKVNPGNSSPQLFSISLPGSFLSNLCVKLHVLGCGLTMNGKFDKILLVNLFLRKYRIVLLVENDEKYIHVEFFINGSLNA